MFFLTRMFQCKEYVRMIEVEEEDDDIMYDVDNVPDEVKQDIKEATKDVKKRFYLLQRARIKLKRVRNIIFCVIRLNR